MFLLETEHWRRRGAAPLTLKAFCDEALCFRVTTCCDNVTTWDSVVESLILPLPLAPLLFPIPNLSPTLYPPLPLPETVEWNLRAHRAGGAEAPLQPARSGG